MGNTYYDTGQQRAGKVNELFTRIAGRYDLINDLQSFGLHRAWKRQVATIANCEPGLRALDVCCGTGDIAFRLAGHGCRVVGLDFNWQMLRVAQSRSRDRRLKGSVPPYFLKGDAQKLPFQSNSFDVVTVGYGLRNLAAWEDGLAEMTRVCAPGGKLIVLDFGKPKHPVWRGCYFTYLQLFVPVVGFVFCGSASAYAYILESLRNYPAQQGVAQQMHKLGLTEVRIIDLLGGVMSINYGERPTSSGSLQK